MNFMNLTDYEFLVESKEACQHRKYEIQMIVQQCCLRFGPSPQSDFNRNLNHLCHQEFDILSAQIKEIDKMMARMRSAYCSHHKDANKGANEYNDSEPIVDPLPGISYNLHSGSHYWDIVHGYPRGV